MVEQALSRRDLSEQLRCPTTGERDVRLYSFDGPADPVELIEEAYYLLMEDLRLSRGGLHVWCRQSLHRGGAREQDRPDGGRDSEYGGSPTIADHDCSTDSVYVPVGRPVGRPPASAFTHVSAGNAGPFEGSRRRYPQGMRAARRLFAILLLGAVALEPLGPASAAIPPGRYAIGDSVMLGASEELTARGIKVNATVSRQFRDAVPLVQRLRAAGRLRRKVIIHLGNNGILIQAADCDRISELAGSNRTVYLVTLKIPRSYRRIQNERLAACAQRRANTVLIDWFNHSRYHPSWFADDGFHLTSTGQMKFAGFIATRTA